MFKTTYVVKESKLLLLLVKPLKNFHFFSTAVLKVRFGRFGKAKEFEFGN